MKPTFRLVDTGWDKIMAEAAASDCSELRVVCPFIKVGVAKRLLTGFRPGSIQIITRFHLGDLCDGVSDTAALRLMWTRGAVIRGVKNLHAKLYLFGDKRAIVTSANLTEAALVRNHEFGFVTCESEIIERCRDYFDNLWQRAGNDLDLPRLERWEKRIAGVRLSGARPSIVSGLSDEGTDVALVTPIVVMTPRVEEARQSFVKFFGEAHSRAALEMPVLEEVKRSGCHWACTYPKSKRPRNVEDGAVMFMGRLVENPDDIIIYGRATGLRHLAGRDEATEDEIKLRDWKKKWPMYVRVHHAEFIAGTLANGIRLSELMQQLKSDSFLPTQRNALKSSGNTDPRSAYRQQPSVELSKEGFGWLNHRLELAFANFGKLTPAELEQLDWPNVTYTKIPMPPPNARKMFKVLTEYLNRGDVDIADPGTFPSYKDTLVAMGLTPWERTRLGPQFNREGGDALNSWLYENRLPALTGLVVNRNSCRPGGDYFKSNGRQIEDFAWWLGEIRRSKEFDWTPYLTER